MSESTDSSPRNSPTTWVTPSEYHRLLSAPCRRSLLSVFETSAAPLPVSELAAALEGECPPETTGAMGSLEVALHHVHLPMMDELEIVDYDVGARRVEAIRTPRTSPN